MDCTIKKADLPRIAEAIRKAVNERGEVDEVGPEDLEKHGLETDLAETIFALICSIDVMSPSVETVMREIGDLAV